MKHKRSSSGLKDLISMEKPWEKYRVVWSEPEGQYDVVALETQWDYALETYFLAHCLGTKDFDEFHKVHVAYSIRDSLKIPHATILCLRDDQFSPYAQANDLGTRSFFLPEVGIRARVLQVRGREDTLAALPFHRIARDWFEAHSGKLHSQPQYMDKFVANHRFGDSDWMYHYGYKLDESVNIYSWAHHNDVEREAYISH